VAGSAQLETRPGDAGFFIPMPVLANVPGFETAARSHRIKA
jgi:hypothetical protein